jgi:hypothetical protein
MVAHFLDVGGIHRVEVAHLLEEDVDMHDVIEVGADGFEHYFEAVEDLSRLRLDIGPGEMASGRVDADVPPIVISHATFAMWLYGPIGSGVLGGVRVSTLGMVPPCVRLATRDRKIKLTDPLVSQCPECHPVIDADLIVEAKT